MTNQVTKVVATAVVLSHLMISAVHGLSHRGAGVTLTFFGYVYVGIVVFSAPLAACVLLYGCHERMGALLLTVSMLGSFGFGVLYHFVLPGTDNVREVPAGLWHLPFFWSAIILAITEVISAGVGLWIYSMIGKRGAVEQSHQ